MMSEDQFGKMTKQMETIPEEKRVFTFNNFGNMQFSKGNINT